MGCLAVVNLGVMLQMEEIFSLEKEKKSFIVRIKKNLIILISLLFFLTVIALIFGEQKTYLERVLSLQTIVILSIVISLPIILYSGKNSIHKIQISNDGILLEGFVFNKLFTSHIEIKDLDVQLYECVNQFGKLEAYAFKFSNGQKKHVLYSDEQWSFSDIYKILIALENIRKNKPFLIDGIHFKKDIENRMNNKRGV